MPNFRAGSGPLFVCLRVAGLTSCITTWRLSFRSPLAVGGPVRVCLVKLRATVSQPCPPDFFKPSNRRALSCDVGVEAKT
ncbi:hypothetical protein B0T18DRAFT_170886 [Schizothecium vesticola]|uniref:Uncharacterized protein n=1 Tax=Schizothecium vesticola TaxID=314040 RepID=A0AA40ENZ3_9PEZI|nr:hypothetical protein B0T18DRAFT_170886 [Schizothecium vesticola]